MSLTVETGAAASDSESYASVAAADAHFSARGDAAWAQLALTEREVALRLATDYMGQTYRMRWKGYRVNTTQALDWPRFDVPQPDAVSIQGYMGVPFYAADVIPTEVVRACIELAARAAAGELLADVAPQVASESVGPISTSYFQGAQRTMTYVAVDRLLSPFLRNAGAGARLVRA